MTLWTRKNAVLPLATLLLVAGVGCRDTTQPLSKKPALTPNADISDGGHGSQRNDDVWFLPPMVSNPQGSPGFGDPFQPGLPVTIRICVKTSTSCSLFTSFGPGQVQSGTDSYQANWDTKSPDTDPALTYRIEVYVGSTPENHVGSKIPSPIAFADVDVVASGNQLKNVNTGEFIPLLDGRTLPVKVRIEKGWACRNNASCVTEVVNNDLPAPVVVESNDKLNSVQLTGHWHDGNFPVVLTIEDISGQQNDNGGPGCTLGLPGIVVTTNHCVRITADPDVVLTNKVIVNTCMPRPSDDRQLLLKYDVDEAPVFLRDAPPPITCPPGLATTNRSTNPLVRFASNALSKVAGFFIPNTAYAIDLGIGGFIDSGGGFSVFTLGFPASMDKVAGDDQTTTTGTAVPVAPQVKLFAVHVHEQPSELNPHPEAIVGAKVTCSASAGSTVGGGTSAEVTTNAAGIATCPSWVLASGRNTLTVRAGGFNQTVGIEKLTDDGEPSTLQAFVTFGATGVDIPNPNITLKDIETRVVNENTIVQFDLTVTNRNAFPDAMFAASPSLPPCGLNTSASRTWVDIFDAAENSRLFGFCAFSSHNDLDLPWFAINAGAPHPAQVYLTLTDRLPDPDKVYTSNTLSLDPVLAVKSVVDNGATRTYNLTVSNRSTYPDVLFTASPNLPACGENTNASRTWVDIYDQSGKYVYGFCALGSGNDLDGIWFTTDIGSKPQQVYITLTDRKTGVVFTSNSVTTP